MAIINTSNTNQTRESGNFTASKGQQIIMPVAAKPNTVQLKVGIKKPDGTKRYVSGTMGGVNVSGEVTTDANGATAKTSCPRAAYITAKARVDYKWNFSNYYTESNSYVPGGTVAVTATKKRGGADVNGENNLWD